MGVSPATIAVSINHDNYTNQCIQDTGKFAISILGENSRPGIIGTFGFKSGRDKNKKGISFIFIFMYRPSFCPAAPYRVTLPWLCLMSA